MGYRQCTLENLGGLMKQEMMEQMRAFYQGRRVLITGHTGFKGAWMCRVLVNMGAKVCGYALAPEGGENLFGLSDVEDRMYSVIGDVRDLDHMMKVFGETQPEIVIHMAAQPIVRTSYEKPVETYEINVMGTVNVMECIRKTQSVRSCINVTTDKVYYNEEGRTKAFEEGEPLMGWDPYSNSKSCSELVTYSYVHAFFETMPERRLAVSTMRAGNVIGGGDFARDRIIPDCYRAARAGEPIIIRNPHSTRPFQHVLEPVMTYLMAAMMQYEDISYAGNYNIGPEIAECRSAGEMADLFCAAWGEDCRWIDRSDGGPKEASFLKLNCDHLKATFDWQQRWHIDETIALTVEWYRTYAKAGDVTAVMDRQINQYMEEENV